MALEVEVVLEGVQVVALGEERAVVLELGVGLVVELAEVQVVALEVEVVLVEVQVVELGEERVVV